MTLHEFANDLRKMGTLPVNDMSDREIADRFRHCLDCGDELYSLDIEAEVLSKSKTTEEALMYLAQWMTTHKDTERFNGHIEPLGAEPPPNSVFLAPGIIGWQTKKDKKAHLALSNDVHDKMLTAMANGTTAGDFLLNEINKEQDGVNDGVPPEVATLLIRAGAFRLRKGLWGLGEDIEFFPSNEILEKDMTAAEKAGNEDAFYEREMNAWAAKLNILGILLGPQPLPNEPCPCGSKKKYKNCCGRSQA